MEQQTNLVSGSIVFRTMLEDLANVKNSGKPMPKGEIAVKPSVEAESISVPFKRPLPVQQAEIFQKADMRKIAKVLIITLAAAMFITGGKFGYDWVVATFFTEEVVVELTPIEQKAFFSVDKSIKVFLNESDDVQAKLIEESDNLYQSGIVQLVVYKDKVNYLNLGELLEKLDLKVPEAIRASLGGEYMLYVSVDGENMDSRYRLNLVLAVKDAESLQNSLSAWEISIQDDLASLHLKNTLSEPASVGFLDNVYESAAEEIVPIRYLNIDNAYTTFDYALVKSKNYLLLTTTKEAIFSSLKAIDAIEAPEETSSEIGGEDVVEEENPAEVSEGVPTSTSPTEEATIVQSRDVLNSFAQALIENNSLALVEFVVESKKESIVDYLVGLETEKRMKLGTELLTTTEVVYEKSNIALYVVDCSFLDVEKECNFYLENIDGEWKIVQM